MLEIVLELGLELGLVKSSNFAERRGIVDFGFGFDFDHRHHVAERVVVEMESIEECWKRWYCFDMPMSCCC